MIFSFFRYLILSASALLVISLISYAVLIRDPLNVHFVEPHFFAGYMLYMKYLLTGDLGISYNGGEPLTDLILIVLPSTLELCFISLLVALLFGIPLGLLAAVYRHRFPGKAIRALSNLGVATPVFWIAPILLYVSAIQHWEISAIGQYNLLYEIKPITGFPVIDVWFTDVPYKIKIVQNVLQHLILPTLVLTLLPTMEIIRLVRQRIEFLLEQNYVKISFTKGWSTWKVLRLHIFRNVFPLLIPQLSRLFTLVLAQCMLVEEIFAWPGIGQWLIDSVRQQDYNSIAAGIIVLGITIVAVNFFAEICRFIIDPTHKRS